MKALVTGATGFIGYEVAWLLAESGTEVRALVRRLNRGALLNPYDVERVLGDLSAPDSLRRAYPHHRVVRVLAALAEVGAGLLGPVLALRRGPQLVTRDTVRSSTVRQPVRRGTLWSDLGLTRSTRPSSSASRPRSTSSSPTAGDIPSTTG